MHNIHLEIWCEECNQIHMDLEAYDKWKCPNCGHTVSTHLSIRNRDWDYA